MSTAFWPKPSSPGRKRPSSRRTWAAKRGDFDSLLIEVSRVLAEHSDNLGFVISPRISQIQFRHLRFMKISEDKVMAILVTPFQMVLTQIVESRTPFTQVELDKAAQYINLNFRGKNLLFIRDFLLRELPKYRLKYEDLITEAVRPGPDLHQPGDPRKPDHLPGDLQAPR